MGTKKEETINFDEEYDMCVSCGSPTSYKKRVNIEYRSGYIEGAGQLCLECAKRDNEEVEHARKLWKQRQQEYNYG